MTTILDHLQAIVTCAVPGSAARRREAELIEARLVRLSGLWPRPVIEAEDVARRRWEHLGRGAA
jgi:hypothetical protein